MEAHVTRRIGAECAPAFHWRYAAAPGPPQRRAQHRRKYLFTDQIDQLIRETYLSHPGAKARPGIRTLAKRVRIPHWALKKRARELA